MTADQKSNSQADLQSGAKGIDHPAAPTPLTSNPNDASLRAELNRLAKHYGGYTQDIMEWAASRIKGLGKHLPLCRTNDPQFPGQCDCTPTETIDVRALIADDAYAISFQSMGQYRAALLRVLNSCETPVRYPHWTCRTHGDFDARVAVGCPECVREMRAQLKASEAPAVRIEHECPRCHAKLLTQSDQCQHPIDATRYGPNGYFCGLCGASTEEPAEKAAEPKCQHRWTCIGRIGDPKPDQPCDFCGVQWKDRFAEKTGASRQPIANAYDTMSGGAEKPLRRSLTPEEQEQRAALNARLASRPRKPIDLDEVGAPYLDEMPPPDVTERQFRPLGGTDWNFCGDCRQPIADHLQKADGTFWCTSPRGESR